jgi:hypothetical protein
MPVKVEVNVKALLQLRQRPQEVLRALDVPLHATVRRALDFSQFLVPRQDPAERRTSSSEGPPTPPLADTGFISGPEYNLTQRLSVTWTAGYEHPAAGPIHEGFHWGTQTINPPPHFLKKAFRKTRSSARKGVGQALAQYLAKHFPPKK